MKIFNTSFLFLWILLFVSSNVQAQKKIRNQELSFPGGLVKLQEYLNENIQFTREQIKKNTEGSINVTFTIDTLGKAKNIRINNSFDELYNDEAIRLLNAMPEWNVEIKKYQKVEKDFTISIYIGVKRDKNFHYNKARIYYQTEFYDLAYLSIQMALLDTNAKFKVYDLMNNICQKVNKQDMACMYLFAGKKYGVAECNNLLFNNCGDLYGEADYKEAVRMYKSDTSDIPPIFAGGNKEIYRFLAKNTKYPHVDREDNVSGRVLATFIVDADGTIRDAYIMKGLSPTINNEVYRVISLLPKYVPAVKNEKRVASRCFFPVNFVL
jgi:outer membrane biosynthesis protein TonB